MDKKITIFSDSQKIIQSMRSELIKELNNMTRSVKTKSFFENKYMFLNYFFFDHRNIAMGFNLKTNVILMFYFWKKAYLTINGLGRYKANFFFRIFFRTLLILNFRKKFIFQNYEDFKQYKNICSGIWIPGSGGSDYNNASKNNNLNFYFIVSRENKYDLHHSSLKSFINEFNVSNTKFIIFGFEREKITDNNNNNFLFKGFRAPKEIFGLDGTFLQLDGYGEGIPHSLVNAICSGNNFVISRKSYYEYGFHILTDHKIDNKEWNLIENKSVNDLKCQLSKDIINKRYLELIKNNK